MVAQEGGSAGEGAGGRRIGIVDYWKDMAWFLAQLKPHAKRHNILLSPQHQPCEILGIISLNLKPWNVKIRRLCEGAISFKCIVGNNFINANTSMWSVHLHVTIPQERKPMDLMFLEQGYIPTCHHCSWSCMALSRRIGVERASSRVARVDALWQAKPWDRGTHHLRHRSYMALSVQIDVQQASSKISSSEFLGSTPCDDHMQDLKTMAMPTLLSKLLEANWPKRSISRAKTMPFEVQKLAKLKLCGEPMHGDPMNSKSIKTQNRSKSKKLKVLNVEIGAMQQA
ncbi:hypothetical protein EV421DRAFT_1746260 [Armillaria borealis]|uniref:Uncharacterized protein n=1 Tax=Armillaria borealis TaxID=47425 RepID=A0AA39IDW2_9AGAR|nr:hypothetical protein EV421DRAFT_1746260 [Armillaria borealis]